MPIVRIGSTGNDTTIRFFNYDNIYCNKIPKNDDKFKKEKEQYDKKIKRYEKILIKLKDLHNKLDSFIYPLDKKFNVASLEIEIKNLSDKIKAFNRFQRDHFLHGEYDLIKKYGICFICKGVIPEEVINKSSLTIDCNRCGISYVKGLSK